jgi:hypothetical protein
MGLERFRCMKICHVAPDHAGIVPGVRYTAGQALRYTAL